MFHSCGLIRNLLVMFLSPSVQWFSPTKRKRFVYFYTLEESDSLSMLSSYARDEKFQWEAEKIVCIGSNQCGKEKSIKEKIFPNGMCSLCMFNALRVQWFIRIIFCHKQLSRNRFITKRRIFKESFQETNLLNISHQCWLLSPKLA